MNTLILNRDFEHPGDGYYQIEAKGYHPTTLANGSRIVQVIDDRAIQSMADKFNDDAMRGNLRHGKEMLVDHEHFKHDTDKETLAYGWANQMQSRPDGLYAQMRWTGTGQAAVDGGDYRFFSTEYDPSDMEVVPPEEVPQAVRDGYKGCKFMRPLRLDGLSLTNENNNRGQKPITNRAPAGAVNTGAAADAKRDAAAIMNRAVELRRQVPGLSLASATIQAQKGNVSLIFNRALALRKSVPNLSLASAVLMAQRENVSLVMNRAGEMMQADASLNLASATRRALREKASPMLNRVAELRAQMPRLGLASAFIMAQRQLAACAE